MTHNIWAEGYVTTGARSGANYFGKFEGGTFRDACDTCFKDEYHKKYYNRERLSYWGCRLFDNQVDAIKTFG